MGKYAIVDLGRYKLLLEDYKKHFTSDDVKRLEYDVTAISLSEEETEAVFANIWHHGRAKEQDDHNIRYESQGESLIEGWDEFKTNNL